MSNWWEKMSSRQLRVAVEGDEVLTTLRHRAAHRTIRVVGAALIAGAVYCLNFTTDPMWETVGFTLAITFFIMYLIYEGILAYDGVMKGEDELIAQLNIPRSTIIMKALFTGVIMGTYITVISRLGGGEFDPVFDTLYGLIAALVFAWLYYSRWRRAVKDYAKSQ